MISVEDSVLLRAARSRIERGVDQYLCFAIGNCRIGTVNQKLALKMWVRMMLKGSSYYEGWLQLNHYNIWKKRQWDTKWKKQARLAWLDWMIAYCEKEEAK